MLIPHSPPYLLGSSSTSGSGSTSVPPGEGKGGGGEGRVELKGRSGGGGRVELKGGGGGEESLFGKHTVKRINNCYDIYECNKNSIITSCERTGAKDPSKSSSRRVVWKGPMLLPASSSRPGWFRAKIPQEFINPPGHFFLFIWRVFLTFSRLVGRRRETKLESGFCCFFPTPNEKRKFHLFLFNRQFACVRQFACARQARTCFKHKNRPFYSTNVVVLTKRKKHIFFVFEHLLFTRGKVEDRNICTVHTNRYVTSVQSSLNTV